MYTKVYKWVGKNLRVFAVDVEKTIRGIEVGVRKSSKECE